MENKKQYLQKLKKPSGFLLFAVYFLTVLFIALAFVFLFVKTLSPFIEIISYVVYGLSAIFLGYSIYTIVIYFGNIKKGILKAIEKNEFGKKMLSHYGFRTVVMATISLIINILYVGFHIVMAIFYRSFWFGSLALYYALLVALRSGIVLYQRKKRKGKVELPETLELKKYRNCGILLTIIPLCLVVPLLQIIFLDRAFIYQGLMVFAFAAYSFYKIIMAIINVVKSKKQIDYTLKAIRSISLADAFVSIFALQTCLLFTFSQGASYQIANVATGIAVFVLTITLGVFMIVNANKKILEIKKEEENEL